MVVSRSSVHLAGPCSLRTSVSVRANNMYAKLSLQPGARNFLEVIAKVDPRSLQTFFPCCALWCTRNVIGYTIQVDGIDRVGLMICRVMLSDRLLRWRVFAPTILIRLIVARGLMSLLYLCSAPENQFFSAFSARAQAACVSGSCNCHNFRSDL